MSDAPGATVKACCKCGVDVSGTRRIKDNKSRYWCESCYESAKAKAIGSPTQPASSDGEVEPDLAALAMAEQAANGDVRVLPELAPLEIEGGAPKQRLRKGGAPQNLLSRPCTECGYELKGLELICTCPECGAKNRAPKPAMPLDKLKEQRDIARNYYLRPFKYAVLGIVGMSIVHLIAGEPLKILIDIIVMVVAVPFALFGYWVYQKVWSDMSDDGVLMNAANLFAVFALASLPNSAVSYVPYGFFLFGWISRLIIFGILLQHMLDLENWSDGVVLAIIMMLISLALAIGIAMLAANVFG
jgi:hypothetical protein